MENCKFLEILFPLSLSCQGISLHESCNYNWPMSYEIEHVDSVSLLLSISLFFAYFTEFLLSLQGIFTSVFFYHHNHHHQDIIILSFVLFFINNNRANEMNFGEYISIQMENTIKRARRHLKFSLVFS